MHAPFASDICRSACTQLRTCYVADGCAMSEGQEVSIGSSESTLCSSYVAGCRRGLRAWLPRSRVACNLVRARETRRFTQEIEISRKLEEEQEQSLGGKTASAVGSVCPQWASTNWTPPSCVGGLSSLRLYAPGPCPPTPPSSGPLGALPATHGQLPFFLCAYSLLRRPH